MNDTQKIIDHCHRSGRLAKQRVGIPEAHEKEQKQKIAAEIELILDEIAAEGVDVVRTWARLTAEDCGQDRTSSCP